MVSKHLASIIQRMSTSSILPPSGVSRFTVTNSGATDHMFPDKSAFISYKLVTHLQVQMGNNSFLPVLGRGSAIISLNGQRILVRNALHVPGLVVPLYSLRAHCLQHGCGFIGAKGVGILIYFPSFVLTVDTTKDCHLTYESLGGTAPIELLHYVQPRCVPVLYPSELASHTALKSVAGHRPLPPPPALIKEDADASDQDSVSWLYPQPKCPASLSRDSLHPQPNSAGPVDLASVTAQLRSLGESIAALQSTAPSPSPAPLSSGTPRSSPFLASAMTREEIVSRLHLLGFI